MTLAELREKKGRLNEEARTILDVAAAAGRDVVNAEEEKKFTAIHADIDQLGKQIRLLEKQDEAERDLSGGGRKTEPNPLDPDVHRSTSRLTQGVRDRQDAIRGWFLAGAKSQPVDAQYVQAAQRCGMDLNRSSINVRMSGSGLLSLRPDEVTRWQLSNDEERAMTGPQSTTSLGGFSIQDEAMREVEIALLSYGAMRRAGCTVLRTDKAGPLPIPTINDSTNLGALIGEGVTVGTQDVTFSQLVLDAWKYTSKSVLVSIELMQDNSINLPQILGRLLGERLGRVTNRDFTTGTGTGQPNGVVNAATFAQATTGAANMTSISLTNLFTLYHSVDPAYRDVSKWMFNDNTLMKFKLMLDSQGKPLWLPGLVDRAPDTLLGSPYVINQDMATMTATAKSILFGDFSKYWIRDVRDFTLVRLDERFAEFLQVGFLAFLRTDGDLVNAGTVPLRGYQNSTA